MANKSSKIGSLSPNAFDAQLLLMDMFFGNVSLKGNKLRTTPNAQLRRLGMDKYVPFFKQKGLIHVNQLMGDLEEKTQKFIEGLTPNEYAKMYPTISLSVIKIHEPEFSFQLPLSEAQKINRNLIKDASSGYYSTNTFGLRSMDMFLDSQTNPFFGKSYIVSFEFVFDSINTYTAPIVGLGGNISYANLFRSSGRVGEVNYGLKLDIGYGSSDSQIIEKYSLNSDEMAFSMFLSFIKSSVEIKENLEVVVKVDYQSREEKMFDSTQLFDILGLDLQAIRERYDQQVKTLSLKRAAIDKAVEKAEAEKRKQFKSDVQEIDIIIPRLIKERKKRLAEIDRRRESAQKIGVPYSTGAPETAVRELSEELKRANDIKQRKLKALQGDRNAILQDYPGLLESAKSVSEAIDKDLKLARGKLNKVRHDQIIESIKQLLNDDLAKNVKKSVSIKSSDLKRYYGDVNYRPGSYGLNKSRKKVLEEAPDSPGNTQTQALQPIATTASATDDWLRLLGVGEEENGENPFQNEIDNLANALSNQKSIDYILLGDLLRLIFNKLFKNIKVKAKNMNKSTKAGGASNTITNITNNLKKSVIILPQLEITNLEMSGPMKPKSLYQFPVSVSHLRYILSRELYGKNKNTFTLFDLMNEIAKLISLTRKRKEQILNRESQEETFTVDRRTYPISPVKSASGFPYKILTKSPFSTLKSDKYLYGMVLNVRKSRQKGSDGINSNIPKFIFGGHDRGIIKNFGLVEYDDDDLQKLILEESSGNSNEIIPSMFSVSMKTVMCPVFQLGMIIRIEAPTINPAADQSNIFIKGNYHVLKINHNFDIASGFTTSIQAALFSDEYQVVEAAVEKSRNLEQFVDRAAENIYEKVFKGRSEGTLSIAPLILKSTLEDEITKDGNY